MCDERRGVVYPCWDTLLVRGQSFQFAQQVPESLQFKGGQVDLKWKLLRVFLTANTLPLSLQLLTDWI